MSDADPMIDPAKAAPREGSLLDKSCRLASRRHFLVGAACAAAAGVAQARMPTQKQRPIAHERFEKWVPNQVGPWHFLTASGVVLPPPDALSDRLYDNLVTRIYDSAERPAVMLAIAYNNVQNGVVQVHRPEFCYPAGGFRLTPTEPVQVKTRERSLDCNFFSAAGYDRAEQVLYWTRIGNWFPRTWAEQRWAVIRANLAGEIPDGMLARVSVAGDDRREAEAVLGEFIRQFEAAVAPPLRRLLLG